MVTLKDIAREAGVSVMTVSNVVNGNMSKVSKETALNVQSIIKRLNYVPNSSARSLAKSNSNIIAIILRGETGQNPLQNPHNAALVGTMVQLLQQHNYYTMVNIMKSENDISQSLRTWNVEGAVFLGMFDDEIERMCAISTIPMVFVDSYSKIRQLSNVGIDDYKGGRLAAQCLLRHGHRSLAFVGPSAEHAGVVQNRLFGFIDELSAHHLKLLPEHRFMLHSDVDSGQIHALAKQLAASKDAVTGAFAASDQIASLLINSLRGHGVDVPGDISLVGFDNIPVCEQLTPQLTTIAQDLKQKAASTIDILLRKLAAPGAPAESLILDVELIERDSVLTIC